MGETRVLTVLVAAAVLVLAAGSLAWLVARSDGDGPSGPGATDELRLEVLEADPLADYVPPGGEVEAQLAGAATGSGALDSTSTTITTRVHIAGGAGPADVRAVLVEAADQGWTLVDASCHESSTGASARKDYGPWEALLSVASGHDETVTIQLSAPSVDEVPGAATVTTHPPQPFDPEDTCLAEAG